MIDLHKPLILASRSPRRINLLHQIGLTPVVMPSGVEEIIDETREPEYNAVALALMKAQDVSRRIVDGIVIGADTIVVIDGRFLGKPESHADAVRMLELLSGNTHRVYTGFALVERPSDKVLTDVEMTLVTFRQLPKDEIERYVSSGSPMDKAGAYGIQDDYGAVFVTRIEGCFYNVVGFPLARFHKRLQEFQSQLNTQGNAR